jgi:hypothetical protein
MSTPGNPATSPGEQEAEASGALLLLSTLLLALLLVSYALKRYKLVASPTASPFVVHESLISITLGLLVGWALSTWGFVPSQGPTTDVDRGAGGDFLRLLAFDHRSFFNLLLPPILFESGFGMRGKRHFFQHLGEICAFAFLGGWGGGGGGIGG